MRSHVWTSSLHVVALAAMVLGMGALAQAQSDDRPTRLPLVPGESSRSGQVDLEIELAAEKEGPRPTVKSVLAPVAEPESGKRVVQRLKATQGTEYFIGVSCSPVDAALRAQLNLPENSGLLVDQVVPDSPAAKAGLRQFDVIVKAGDRSIGDQKALGEAVQATSGKELRLAILRGGKSETITLVPAKREPAADARLRWEAELAPPDRDVIIRWLERGSPDGLRMHLLRPGYVIEPHVSRRKLPKNVSVSIHKTGEQPAKIIVERDGKKWEVTEDKLDDLPKDLRGHVQGLLGGPQVKAGFSSPLLLFGEGEPATHSGKALTLRSKGDDLVREKNQSASDKQLDKRLEELNQKLEKLQRAVDDLRGGKDQGRH